MGREMAAVRGVGEVGAKERGGGCGGEVGGGREGGAQSVDAEKIGMQCKAYLLIELINTRCTAVPSRRILSRSRRSFYFRFRFYFGDCTSPVAAALDVRTRLCLSTPVHA
jgi:hypothetical protein